MLNQISEKSNAVFKKYGVKTAGVFGSFARGENSSESDIDLLVSFEQPITLFQFFSLKDELRDVLDNEVDVVSENSVLPYFKDYIFKDLIKIYG